MFVVVRMKGLQRTAVSRKELREKLKLKELMELSTKLISGHHDTGPWKDNSKSYSRQAVNSLCETIMDSPLFLIIGLDTKY